MDREILVKFVAKGNLLTEADIWRRQLPANQSAWGNCRFTFDPEASEYDWLVAYDDLPPGSARNQQQKTRLRTEKLACPREHTLLITAEPSSIKVYSKDFLNQFGVILTSQEPWAIPHANAIFSQPALRWFYGLPYGKDRNGLVDLDTLRTMKLPVKKHNISTVCSDKRMSYTTHSRRYDFVQELKAALPELEVFGHGVREIDDKALALDDYRYHIAIENHVCDHHWTEKLSDAFLGYTLPLYYGAPNAADYFPPQSFIPIDIHDLDASLATIQKTIENNEYEKRLPYIMEARQQVLEQYNIFAVIEREIRRLHDPSRTAQPGDVIMSRHALRRSSLRHYIREMLDRLRVKFNRPSTRSR